MGLDNFDLKSNRQQLDLFRFLILNRRILQLYRLYLQHIDMGFLFLPLLYVGMYRRL